MFSSSVGVEGAVPKREEEEVGLQQAYDNVYSIMYVL